MYSRNQLIKPSHWVKSPGVFHCPADPDGNPTDIVTADQMLPDSARLSYEFYNLWWAPELGPLLTKFKGQAPLIWDIDGGEKISPLKNHKGGGNVVYADGHAAWQETKLWDAGSWPSPADRFYPKPPYPF